MTNESISGFLNSIAEAKRAFDQEPIYQQRIKDLEQDQRRLGDTVASRELRIHELKQNEEALTAKLRSVEAERDDAGFRALEEADKVQNLLGTLRGFITDGLKVLSAVEGKESLVISKDVHQGNLTSIGLLEDANQELKGELQSLRNDMRLAQEQLHRPLAVPYGTSSSRDDITDPSSSRPITDWEQDKAETFRIMPSAIGEGQREVDPTTSISHTVQGAEASIAESSLAIAASHEGQSDGPFASSVTTGNTPEPQTASSTSAENGESAASSASQPERNRDRSTFFTGRKYYDVTYFVPLHQWLNEGGTREDYHWRPEDDKVPTQFNRSSHQS